MPRRSLNVFLTGALAAATSLPVLAESLLHRAENQVPVAIVKIERLSDRTEINLQAQAALQKVCFAASGPSSPYLLAEGRTFRYLGGENVAQCPDRRDYAAGDMVLRFQPLEAGSSTFSFVSGPGEEKQSIDAVSPTAPRWNFLRVRLN